MNKQAAAVRVFGAVGCALLGLGSGAMAHAGDAMAPVVPIAADQASEVPLAPPLRLPLFGPRYAPVTLDLYIGVGQRGGDSNLALALQRAREESDVRLLLHPVVNGLLAERGAEVIWEACEQQPATCFTFISQLFTHLDWLVVTSEGEEALLAGAAAAGLDAPRLRRSLYSHRHRAQVSALWLATRDVVRYPPELWINGHRLTGTLTEAQLREEIDSQRTRAQRLRQAGTPLTQLYERLVAEEAPQRTDDSGAGLGRPYGRMPLPPPTRSPTPELPAHLDLTGVPSRGPRIAPVTLIVIGSLDTSGTYEVARAAYEVWSQHPDSLRLLFLQAPGSDKSQRIARLLAQVALLDPGRFWRLFDGILSLFPLRNNLQYSDVETLARRELGSALLETALRTPAAQNRLNQDLELVRRLGIEYPPVVLVNGLAVRGSPLGEALELAIVRESQRGLLQRLRAPTAPRADPGWLIR